MLLTRWKFSLMENLLTGMLRTGTGRARCPLLLWRAQAPNLLEATEGSMSLWPLSPRSTTGFTAEPGQVSYKEKETRRGYVPTLRLQRQLWPGSGELVTDEPAPKSRREGGPPCFTNLENVSLSRSYGFPYALKS